MKLGKINSLKILTFGTLLLAGNIVNAQPQGSYRPSEDSAAESPPTTKTRVENLKKRHGDAMATLRATLDQIDSNLPRE